MQAAFVTREENRKYRNARDFCGPDCYLLKKSVSVDYMKMAPPAGMFIKFGTGIATMAKILVLSCK